MRCLLIDVLLETFKKGLVGWIVLPKTTFGLVVRYLAFLVIFSGSTGIQACFPRLVEGFESLAGCVSISIKIVGFFVVIREIVELKPIILSEEFEVAIDDGASLPVVEEKGARASFGLILEDGS